jgi:hypothetical protein
MPSASAGVLIMGIIRPLGVNTHMQLPFDWTRRDSLSSSVEGPLDQTGIGTAYPHYRADVARCDSRDRFVHRVVRDVPVLAIDDDILSE